MEWNGISCLSHIFFLVTCLWMESVLSSLLYAQCFQRNMIMESLGRCRKSTALQSQLWLAGKSASLWSLLLGSLFLGWNLSFILQVLLYLSLLPPAFLSIYLTTLLVEMELMITSLKFNQKRNQQSHILQTDRCYLKERKLNVVILILLLLQL